LANYVTDPTKSIIPPKRQGTQSRQIQIRNREAILRKMRILKSHLPIRFAEGVGFKT